MYCLLYFDVALWSCKEGGFLKKVLKAIFTDFELAQFIFIRCTDSCLRLGYTRNSTKKILVKPLDWISGDFKYTPENILHIESIPNRTAYNCIFSSLYPPAYYGSSEDRFLVACLIPYLRKVSSSGDSLMNILRLSYPDWSVIRLRSDWVRNEDIWSHYIIQKDGDPDHVRRFNDSKAVYVYRYGH